jgi:hypothetical protein
VKFWIFCFIFLPTIAKAQCDSIRKYIGDGYPSTMTYVEEMPHFPGGDDARIAFFKENIKLPDQWPPDSITGKVFITFIVDVKGNIKYPCVLRGLNPILDSIAIVSVKKMPNWIPAIQRGVPFAVQFNLPITFGQSNKKKR